MSFRLTSLWKKGGGRRPEGSIKTYTMLENIRKTVDPSVSFADSPLSHRELNL